MNEPVQRFRVGLVTASIWQNEVNGKPFFNVSLSRAYKDNGEWKQTDGLAHGDLLNAAKVLERSEEWISQQ